MRSPTSLRRPRTARAFRAAWSGGFVAAILVSLAPTAWAQGYTITPATNRSERRPAVVNPIDVSSTDPAKSSVRVPLPFPFWYYGKRCTEAVVSAHGWMLPGAKEGFADAGDPAAVHGQDPRSGAFPYGADGASADGICAPLWTRYAAVGDETLAAGEVVSWTTGEAPRRKFVVAWQRISTGTLAGVTVQAQFHEADGTIVFAYTSETVTGDAPEGTKWVCGLDEPGGARFTAPVEPTAENAGLPPSDFEFVPRSAVLAREAAPQPSVLPVWTKSRTEALRGPDGANTCWYVANGDLWFWTPDRFVRGKPARKRALIDEDRATFPAPSRPAADGTARPAAAGDAERCVRQVLDGKVVLVPDDGGPPLRLWFRVIEFVTLDDRGLAGPDDHIWNLRILLSKALPAGDPRSRIENWAAWRASASARLTVGKLFDATTADDSGPQFDTGRVGESVNWCARLRVGRRGPMPPYDCPTEGWVRLGMKEKDTLVPQHAEKGDIRFVPDPNYVDQGYDYVVVSDDAPTGWISRRRPPPARMVDEPFEFDPRDPPADPPRDGR